MPTLFCLQLGQTHPLRTSKTKGQCQWYSVHMSEWTSVRVFDVMLLESSIGSCIPPNQGYLQRDTGWFV